MAFKLIKSTNLLYFGLDYMRLIFSDDIYKETCYFDFLFKGLSENSDFTKIDFFGFKFNVYLTKTNTRKILHFHYGLHRVFSLVKSFDVGIGRYQAFTMDFSGVFFQLDFYEKILVMLFRYKRFIKVTRIDIACDISCSPSFLINKGYRTQFKTGTLFGVDEKTGNFQTKYFGSKKSSNKRHLIRVYDKLLDSKTKSKIGLFKNYFSYENVTRIECEVRHMSCMSFGVDCENVLDADFLKIVFKSICLNKSGTEFFLLREFLNTNFIPIKMKKRSLNDVSDFCQYVKIFKSYARTLNSLGFDAVCLANNAVYDV